MWPRHGARRRRANLASARCGRRAERALPDRLDSPPVLCLPEGSFFRDDGFSALADARWNFQPSGRSYVFTHGSPRNRMKMDGSNLFDLARPLSGTHSFAARLANSMDAGVPLTDPSRRDGRSVVTGYQEQPSGGPSNLELVFSNSYTSLLRLPRRYNSTYSDGTHTAHGGAANEPEIRLFPCPV